MNINKTVLILLLVQVTFQSAQYQTKANEKGTAFYLNPVFAGDYPNPSILLDDDDYYMVHSCFEYYPGLLIWHSKDLMNWSPVKNTLHKYVDDRIFFLNGGRIFRNLFSVYCFF